MQIQNLQIYNYATADASHNGPWIDISNLVSLSVQINNVGSAGIEVSNDPNVNINGPGIGPPSVPVLSQFPSLPGFASLVGGLNDTPSGATYTPDVSQLPATTFYVKITYVTKWGETSASSESVLAVTRGNYLFVAAPTISGSPADNVPAHVIGWNVYVGLSSGAEVLQTGPQFAPQQSVDGYGTVGGTVNPLGPGQSTHFAISGALPLAQNFSMVNGFQQTQWAAPSADNSGGTNSGVNVGSLTTSVDAPVAIFYQSPNTVWSPSSMTWKWLRVVSGGSTTAAFLNGQRG